MGFGWAHDDPDTGMINGQEVEDMLPLAVRIKREMPSYNLDHFLFRQAVVAGSRTSALLLSHR